MQIGLAAEDARKARAVRVLGQFRCARRSNPVKEVFWASGLPSAWYPRRYPWFPLRGYRHGYHEGFHGFARFRNRENWRGPAWHKGWRQQGASGFLNDWRVRPGYDTSPAAVRESGWVAAEKMSTEIKEGGRRETTP